MVIDKLSKINLKILHLKLLRIDELSKFIGKISNLILLGIDKLSEVYLKILNLNYQGMTNWTKFIWRYCPWNCGGMKNCSYLVWKYSTWNCWGMTNCQKCIKEIHLKLLGIDKLIKIYMKILHLKLVKMTNSKILSKISPWKRQIQVQASYMLAWTSTLYNIS